jgi:demethylmenaquinone methyltransferase/2-methoxy-6-polyprenyl-1,4-benzoquinol methylase
MVETFDAVVSTYLFRYVQDPSSTIRELSRVLKPGGQLVSLEFGVPPPRWIRALWLAYTRTILPVLTIPAPGGWHEAGCFLGPSISRFCKRYPVSKLEEMWSEHGFPTVKIKYLLGGVAVAMWGKKTQQVNI